MAAFEAFQFRLARRLGERLTEAKQEQNRLLAEAAQKGHLNSGRRIICAFEAAKKQARDASDWAIEEAIALAQEKSPTSRRIHREHLTPILGEALRRFAEELAGSVTPRGAPIPQEHIARLREEVLAVAEGDVSEYAQGVWRPEKPSTEMSMTNNHVKVEGSFRGTLQQGGDGATQTATVNFNQQSVADALNTFVAALQAVALDQSHRDEIMAEVDTIRAQLRKSRPNSVVLDAAFKGIGQIATSVASAALAPHVQALLAAVGVS